jgi:uncharacterized protein (DUF427 family)
MSIRIQEKGSGTLLAEGQIGDTVVKYEGNLYFHPDGVTTSVLRITDRTYTCPYKGTCNWVDYVAPDGTHIQSVAWVYPTTKPGHELIAGRYGFYAGNRGATREEQGG